MVKLILYVFAFYLGLNGITTTEGDQYMIQRQNSTYELEDRFEIQNGSENMKNLDEDPDEKEKSNKDKKLQEKNVKSLDNNIVLTSFVIFFHLFIIFFIGFLIFKSHKAAERRIRMVLKYRPSKNWVEPQVEENTTHQ